MREFARRIVLCLAVIALTGLLGRPARAELREVKNSWEDAGAFARCTRQGEVNVSPDGVRLARSVLFQDEVGSTHYRNREPLSETVWARKVFQLADPRCQKARLFAFGAASEALCNGTSLGGGRRLPSTGWRVWDVPPEALETGRNEFVFRGGGRLIIENSLYPNRSARSADAGKTWDSERLGPQGVQNGEYVVRLRLDQYPRSASLTSQVVDLAGDGAIHPGLEVREVKLMAETDGSVSLQLRTGPGRRPDATWSGWRPAAAEAPQGGWQRYVQWRARLATSDVTRTPVLTAVELAARVETLDVATGTDAPQIQVLELTRPQRQRRSQPFAHQGNSRRVRALRENYDLEEVVSAGTTDMERFVLLRDWARHTAPKGWNMGASQWCPPWDAMILLETNKKPIGLNMCTHYSTIFVQAAVALGYNARHVVLDHHCAAEVWSNELGKWILIDAGNSRDPSRNCHFEKDGSPLSALEIRRLWKAGRTDEIEIVFTPPRQPVSGDKLENQVGFSVFRRFSIPFRNNHLSSPFPGELTQGVSPYYGDFYLWWEDGAVPAESPEYSHTSNRTADFYWSLNQTGIDLQRTDQPGALQVTLDTVTPNFKTFEISMDGGPWNATPARFQWVPPAGEHTLEARSVNDFGVRGKKSVARLRVE